MYAGRLPHVPQLRGPKGEQKYRKKVKRAYFRILKPALPELE